MESAPAMLKITRKFDYAMLVLAELGLHPGMPVSARSISARHRLSPSLAANVLKCLQRGALVRSTRGVNGGYVLARPPSRLALSAVMRAMHGTRTLARCVGEGKPRRSCPAHATCPARVYMGVLEKRVRAVFDRATLADVIGHAPAARRRPSGGG